MGITELNLIGDFVAGMKCLQNPYVFIRFSSIDYSFWKWGALILAIFATFTSLINTIKLLIHQIRLKSQQSCSQKNYNENDFDFDFSDDDDEDTPSSVAESDEEEFDSEDYQKPVDEVFRSQGSSYWGNDRGQDGNFTLRRRNGFSWSDFSAGKSVVQMWDSFGLGLDFEDDDCEYENETTTWNFDRDNVKISRGGQRQVPAAANVVLTAAMADNDGAGDLGAYDAGLQGKIPAIYAAWQPRQGKVYVKDNGAVVENVMKLE